MRGGIIECRVGGGVKPSTVSGCIGGPVVALLVRAAASNWGINMGVELGRAVSIMTVYWWWVAEVGWVDLNVGRFKDVGRFHIVVTKRVVTVSWVYFIRSICPVQRGLCIGFEFVVRGSLDIVDHVRSNVVVVNGFRGRFIVVDRI